MATAASEIKDRKTFDAWLEGRLKLLPHTQIRQDALALANRCAMRVLPLTHRNRKLSEQEFARLTKVTFQVNTISRVAATNETGKIVLAAAAAAADDAATYSAASADAAACYAAAADDAAYSATAVAGDDSVAAAASYVADAAAAAAYASGGSSDSAWQMLASDALFLEQGGAIIGSPLWLHVPGWWMKQRDTFFKHLQTGSLAGEGFGIWVRWYDDIAEGRDLFGIKDSAIRASLERNIALGSKDGTYNKTFWKRGAKEINADVKRWVEEAQAADAVSRPNPAGLLFTFARNLMRIAKREGLAHPSDDQSFMSRQLPLLRQMVERLETKFKNQPLPEDLLFALSMLSNIISRDDLRNVDPGELFTVSSAFRGQVIAAKTPAPGTNLYELEGSNLKSCESVYLIADLIVRATERGRALYDEADRVGADAGQEDRSSALASELFALVARHGQLMDADDLALIQLFLRSVLLSPHPVRVGVVKAGTVQNAVVGLLGGSVLLGFSVATFSVASSSVGFGFIGLALLGLVGKESLKKSKHFKTITDKGGEIFDLTVESLQEAIDGKIPTQLRVFVLKHRELFKAIAGEKESGKTILMLLDIIERQEAEAKKVLEKSKKDEG